MRFSLKEVAEAMAQRLPTDSYKIVYNSTDADYIVYLSGCSAGCADRANPSELPQTVVAGLTVDWVSVKEDEIVDKVLQSINKKLHKN